MDTEFKPFDLTPEQIEKLAEESSVYIKELINGLQKLLLKNKQFIMITLSVLISMVNCGKYIWKTMKLIMGLYVFIYNLIAEEEEEVDEEDFKNEMSNMMGEATKPLMEMLSGLGGMNRRSDESSEDISDFSDDIGDPYVPEPEA